MEEEKKALVKKPNLICRLARPFLIGLVSLGIVIASAGFLTGCTQPAKKVEDEVPKGEIALAVGALEAQNYTFNLTENNLATTYNINPSKVKVEKDGSVSYYEKSADVTYSYVSATGGYYSKDYASFDINGVIYNSLKGATWTEYNKESDLISGEMNGKDVTLKIESDGDLTIEAQGYKAEITDIGTTSVSLPDKSLVIDKTVQQSIPVEKVTELLEKISGKNYILSETIGQNSKEYHVYDNAVKIVDGAETTYQVVEDGKTYEYYLSNDDSKWHKKEAESTIVETDLIYNKIENVEWLTYDDVNKMFTGTLNGEVVSLYRLAETYVLTGNGYEGMIYNVGDASFELPSGKDLVDDTVVVPPVVNELYTLENGRIQYDMAVVSEVVTNWIKGENSYSQDLISVKEYYAPHISLNRVLFVNVLDGKMEIGVFTNVGSDRSYTIWELYDTTFMTSLNNGTYKTKDQLLAGLRDTSIRRFKNTGINQDVAYSTLDADYVATNKTEFEKLTVNVLEKLNETGVQTNYLDENGVTEDLTDIEIVAGFRTVSKGMGLGYELGNYSEWNQYYIAKVNGTYQILNFRIESSNTYNNDVVGNVANGTEGWMIGALEKKDLDKDTIAIYESHL